MITESKLLIKNHNPPKLDPERVELLNFIEGFEYRYAGDNCEIHWWRFKADKGEVLKYYPDKKEQPEIPFPLNFVITSIGPFIEVEKIDPKTQARYDRLIAEYEEKFSKKKLGKSRK
jgi:hypothetical protein